MTYCCLLIQGKTPLHWAAENGHDKTCSLLISTGASLNVQDKDVSNHITSVISTSYYYDNNSISLLFST